MFWTGQVIKLSTRSWQPCRRKLAVKRNRNKWVLNKILWIMGTTVKFGPPVWAFWAIFWCSGSGTQTWPMQAYSWDLSENYLKCLINEWMTSSYLLLNRRKRHLYFHGVGRWCRWWCAGMASWRGICRTWLPMTLMVGWRDGILYCRFHWQSVSFFVLDRVFVS